MIIESSHSDVFEADIYSAQDISSPQQVYDPFTPHASEPSPLYPVEIPLDMSFDILVPMIGAGGLWPGEIVVVPLTVPSADAPADLTGLTAQQPLIGITDAPL